MVDNVISRREVLAGTGAGLGALALGPGTAGATSVEEYNVGTESSAAKRAAERAAAAVTRVLEWDDGKKTVTGRFTEKAIANLDNRPDVRYTERNGEMRAIAQDLPWGIDRVDAEVAHANGETGGDDTDGDGGADIAIIDTGIDSDHTDLATNIGDGKAFVDCIPLSDRRGGCGFGVQTNDNPCYETWDDDNNHGSHVSGTADAIDDDSHVVGVSTTATLHAVKVLDACGSGTFSDVAAGIEWVADQGYDVANMSLGGDKSSTVEDAVEYAHGNGVLLVAAAGNDGPCSDCVGYPAAEPEVIAVSATTNDDSLADFSSTGSEVELAGPGEDIVSTVPPESDSDGLTTFSGTSMASPHVAGAGGQLMDNGYSNTQARNQLSSTAEDIGLGSNEQGNGLVDVAASLGLDSSDDLEGGNSAPAVDSLSASEVETDDSDAEFDVDWSVSDSDGNLDSVDLTLTDDTDGETEDTASISVGGDTASGTNRLIAAGDDGSGNSYTVEAVVTDGDGATDSATDGVTESEGNTAPSASVEDVTENETPSPHAAFDISWSASDDDGNLDSVTVTLDDDTDNETEGTDTIDVSGGAASGTTQIKAKHDDTSGNDYTATVEATDTQGASGSDSTSFSENGS